MLTVIYANIYPQCRENCQHMNIYGLALFIARQEKEQTYVNSKASVLKNDFLVWYKISLQGLHSLF